MKRNRVFSVALAILVTGSLELRARPLMEHFKTGSLEQQITAMYYFGYSRNKESFWYMVENLNRSFGDRDENTWGERFRVVAAESLGRLGDERAVPFLIKRYQEEKKENVKRSIILALGFYRNKEILPVIKDGLQSGNKEILAVSLETAAKFGDTSVLPQVKGILGSQSDTNIQIMSYLALIRLGDDPDKNAEKLKKELTHRDPTNRFLSASCLAMTDRHDAIDDIIKALEIENYPWVRKEMEFALVMLAKKKKDAEER